MESQWYVCKWTKIFRKFIWNLPMRKLVIRFIGKCCQRKWGNGLKKIVSMSGNGKLLFWNQDPMISSSSVISSWLEMGLLLNLGFPLMFSPRSKLFKASLILLIYDSSISFYINLSFGSNASLQYFDFKNELVSINWNVSCFFWIWILI